MELERVYLMKFGDAGKLDDKDSQGGSERFLSSNIKTSAAGSRRNLRSSKTITATTKIMETNEEHSHEHHDHKKLKHSHTNENSNVEKPSE